MYPINWKTICTSGGYRSLKAAYIHDVQDVNRTKQLGRRYPMRNKEEFRKRFNWIIQRATHIAIRRDLPVNFVLNHLEAGRKNSWWFGYYQNSRMPKVHSHVLKQLGLKGLTKHRIKSNISPEKRKALRVQELKTWDKQRSTKSRKRWSSERKQRGY